MSGSPDVIVVGGGAGGIIAAWNAASRGARVLLLEKTARLGTKILVSGGGKCNICHDGDLEDVLRAYRPNEAKFLKPSFYKFTNRQTVELFTTRGLEVYSLPDGRIFPVHQTARDVVGILRRMLESAGVTVRYESAVTGIETSGDIVRGVRTANETLYAERTILATGGSSYPNSGTTGDGFRWATGLGHNLCPVYAALAPVYLQKPLSDLSGLALRDVLLKARCAGKEVARWRGDLLITHQGISGPCALAISRTVVEHMADGDIHLEVDLTPDESFEQVGKSLTSYSQSASKSPISGWIEGIVPNRFAELIGAEGQINIRSLVGQIDRKSKNRLIELVKGFRLGLVRAVPLEKGEVVAGGYPLDEVDSQTMASKFKSGLFICGEVLDIAGPVGGYNLQAAWSTGYVAGSV